MAPSALTPRPRTHTRLSMWGLWFLVAVPAVLILTCGILILAYQQSVFEVTIGLLLVIFCAALGAGVTLVVIGIRMDRRLLELQLDFVSKCSHELKTPLTSIRMFVETLRLGRAPTPESQAECLEIIAKETERLTLLITRLLSWGAMEAGAFKIKLDPIAPEDLARRAIDAFDAQAKLAQLDVRLTVAPGLPAVLADANALTDALLNLLTNAQRYGGDARKIEVDVRARPDGQVAFSVRDHGIGIAPKHQRHIFDRFYRADDEPTRAVGGTGLGLAITKHIVTAHRGAIELVSAPGAGSTFTVVLPAHAAPEPAGAAEATA